jgi:hypothetical protein
MKNRKLSNAKMGNELLIDQRSFQTGVALGYAGGLLPPKATLGQ